MKLRLAQAAARAARAMLGSAPARDDAWFEAVYRNHLGYVFGALRRLGVDERDRPDLAQDVFVVVHRHREAFDDSRPLRPWLFGIAFRIARRAADKHSKRFEVLSDSTDLALLATTTTPDMLVDDARARARLRAALALLDADKRMAFLLCDVEELSVPAAAELLGENVNTVGARLRAARLALRAVLRDPSTPREPS